MLKQQLTKAVALSALLLAGAACTTTPEPEPEPAGPVDPVEAFKTVGEPDRDYVGPGTTDPDNLSQDIERLQDARREYNHAQDRQNAEHRRSQKECLEGEGGRKVPIEDGAEDPAVYCED